MNKNNNIKDNQPQKFLVGEKRSNARAVILYYLKCLLFNIKYKTYKKKMEKYATYKRNLSS